MAASVRDLAWAYHRLRAMSAWEIPYRLSCVIRGKLRRRAARATRTVYHIPAVFSDVDCRPETFLAHLRDRDSPHFFVEHNTNSPGGIEPEVAFHKQTLERAERVLARDVNINWHADPGTQVEWPTVFHGDIRVRDSDEVGDVRAVWEVNRQQWLFDVAVSYYLTGDDRHAEFTERVMEHWIEANPIDLGVNWKSGMEAAIRGQTWIWLAFLLCGSDRPRLSSALVHGIWSHIKHVEANLSRFSSANNHLMVEATTLFIAGVLFPEFEGSSSWRRTGERVITDEIRRQVRPDGVSAEQSIHYHAFVLEALLFMAILAKKNAIALDLIVLDRIRGMLSFLSAVTDDSGQVPAIGDSDDGRVSPLSRNGESYYSYVLTLGREFGGRSVQGIHASERALWVAGVEPIIAEATLCRAHQPLTMKAFPDSGYVVIQDTSNRSRLTFDGGPHGLEQLCAHAHADALSVTLSVRGVDILIDSGTYVYNIRQAERDALRATEAHNTFLVDGRSQSEAAGPFLWLTKTDAVMECSVARSWFAFTAAHHDGYRPVRHSRMVLALAHDAWIIVDTLTGQDCTHSYEHNLNLGEALHPRGIEGGWVLEECADPVATVLVSSWPGLSLETRSARASKRFLELHPIDRVVSSVEARGEVKLITACFTGALPPVLKERGQGILRVEYDNLSRYVLTGDYQSDDLQFDGGLLYLECTDQGQLRRSFAHGCRSLWYRGQDLGKNAEGPHGQMVVE